MFGFRVSVLAVLTVDGGGCACRAGLFGQELYLPAIEPEPFISEVRGGILPHSVDETGPVNIFGVGNFERIQDVNVELLFTPPDADFWRIIGNPRPHVGATVNFAGLESMAYAGLTWRLPIFDTGIFIEGGLGGAVTNGALSGAVYPARNLGCAFQFHEQLHRRLPGHRHISAPCSPTSTPRTPTSAAPRTTAGSSNLGVRVGWTF